MACRVDGYGMKSLAEIWCSAFLLNTLFYFHTVYSYRSSATLGRAF